MMIVRGGKLVGAENSVFEGVDESLTSYLMQFYTYNPPVCDEIITDAVTDGKALETALSDIVGRKIHVLEPKQGVRKQLLDLAHANATDALEKHGTIERRKEIRTIGAVKQLAELLALPTLPNRIECFDISHVSGVDKVSSMVVFEGGEPKKSHYRKFKIKTVEGNNDFASMKETLTRRLERLNNLDETDESFRTLPDLIVVDGGKGQLTYAIDALAKAGRSDIALISLAEREEEVFVASAPKTRVMLSKDTVALQLLQRVRDEAHRFAITYHRNLHGKRMTESVLREIEGVGKVKSASLIKKFGSVENIRRATVEEIASVDGFSINSAEKLKQNLETALADKNK